MGNSEPTHTDAEADPRCASAVTLYALQLRDLAHAQRTRHCSARFLKHDESQPLALSLEEEMRHGALQ